MFSTANNKFSEALLLNRRNCTIHMDNLAGHGIKLSIFYFCVSDLRTQKGILNFAS